MPIKQKKNSNQKPLVIKYKAPKTSLTFEALVKPGSIEPYRQGKLPKDQILISDQVYRNASKFQKAKASELTKGFQTDNLDQCLKIILDQGSYSLTKKELQEKTANKRSEILNHLHKYYHDPTKDPVIPHPISRLDQALTEMGITIDPHTPTQKQLQLITKKLPDFLRVKYLEPTD